MLFLVFLFLHSWFLCFISLFFSFFFFFLSCFHLRKEKLEFLEIKKILLLFFPSSFFWNQAFNCVKTSLSCCTLVFFYVWRFTISSQHLYCWLHLSQATFQFWVPIFSKASQHCRRFVCISWYCELQWYSNVCLCVCRLFNFYDFFFFLLFSLVFSCWTCTTLF